MSALGKFIKRNCQVYFRDRAMVFSSLLSMLIVLILMIVFLGDMNIDSIVNILNEYGLGTRDAVIDRENAREIVILWTIAGIIVVNAVMVTIEMIGIMVQDQHEGKMASFYVAPVSRFTLTLGYILASMIASVIMCILSVIVAAIYLAANGWAFMSLLLALKLLGLIVLTVFNSASIVFLLAVFVNSTGAWNGLGTIIGTLVGFLGGIYLPVGALPASVVNVMKCFPVLHESAMLREILTNDAITRTFTDMSVDIIPTYKEEMGITIKMFGETSTPLFQVLFMVGYGIIALVVATIVLSKKGVRDR